MEGMVMMEGKKLRGNRVWIANMRGLVCKGYKFFLCIFYIYSYLDNLRSILL